MSKKEWIALLFIYLLVLLVGAAIFVYLEAGQEMQGRETLHRLKVDIKGYGHMSPTTDIGRIFCVLYALVGVPLNGILFTNLGEFFSTKIIRAHHKFKEIHYESKVNVFVDTVFYLVPGIMVFIFLPAGVFVAIEGWNYIEAVYYAFITLTTIGFGDYVAGRDDHGSGWIWVYKISIVVWIIFGLGYLVMIIGFIQKAIKSKKVKTVERKFARALRRQANKFNQNLPRELKLMRKLLNAITLMQMKQAYEPPPVMKTATSQPNLASEEPFPIRRSASDAALQDTSKTNGEAFNQRVAQIHSVTIFLEMAEALLKHHGTADSNQLTITSCLSTSEASDDTNNNTSTERDEDAVEKGVVNVAFDETENDISIEKIPSRNSLEAHQKRLKNYSVTQVLANSPALQRKLSELGIVPPTLSRGRSASFNSVKDLKINDVKISTMSDLLGLMECMLCDAWREDEADASPSTTRESTPSRCSHKQRFSFPTRIRHFANDLPRRATVAQVFQSPSSNPQLLSTHRLSSTEDKETDGLKCKFYLHPCKSNENTKL
ncbi:uncharacterized protein LOC143038106 isoform X3 [Oratosquilla oratoria]|uniref:uncharacterized protein LOC143038106 isoform X3 n=1 Tax=Oratosquilla oratoria TaxID=337810 RepID=UPI003F75E626